MSYLDIRKKRKELGLTQQQLADKLGVDRRTIINYEKGTTIPESKVKLFSMIFDAVSRKEDVIVSEKLTDDSFTNKNGNTFTELNNGKYKIEVKKIHVKALGSYISHHDEPGFLEDLETVTFTVDHIGRGKYICFEVQGDSMNGGGINDAPEGAELLCRELGRQHWKDGFRDSVYGWVIVHKDTVLYKDIKDFNSETGDIICSSRSGLPQHPDFTINLNDVRQIWKVIKRSY